MVPVRWRGGIASAFCRFAGMAAARAGVPINFKKVRRSVVFIRSASRKVT
jgi:hypothetical protein